MIRRLVLAFALCVLAVAAFGQEQRAEVFRLQFQRFQGDYKVSGSGSFNVKVTGDGADIFFEGKIASKDVKLHATTTYDAKTEKQVASLDLDGKVYRGTASIDGQDLTFKLKDGDQTRRLLVHRIGRSQGVFTLFQREGSKPEGEIFRISGKRSS